MVIASFSYSCKTRVEESSLKVEKGKPIPEELENIPVGIMIVQPCPNEPKKARIYICTGTRIGQNTVVTARHCTEEESVQGQAYIWNDYKEMHRVRPIKNRFCEDPAPYLIGKSIHKAEIKVNADESIARAHERDLTRIDIAILKSNQLASQRTIRIASAKSVITKTRVILLGLGTQNCQNIDNQGSKYGAALFTGTFSFPKFQQLTTLSIDTSTCGGDSGAGLLVEHRNELKIVAVHSQGTFFSPKNKIYNQYNGLLTEASGCKLLRANLNTQEAQFQRLDTLCPLKLNKE